VSRSPGPERTAGDRGSPRSARGSAPSCAAARGRAGPAPGRPLVLHIHREAIHHDAGVSLLRDLDRRAEDHRNRDTSCVCAAHVPVLAITGARARVSPISVTVSAGRPSSRSIEKHRAVGQGERGLRRRERLLREVDPADVQHVLPRRLTTAQADPGLWSRLGRQGHGDVDDVRRPVAHPVPVGRRRPRDRGTVTCPQRRRTHPRLVPEPMPTHQIGPGMQARPHSITRPPVDSGGGHPAAHGLRQRDHPGLPRHQRLEGHRPSMTDTHDSRGRSGQADAMISA